MAVVGEAHIIVRAITTSVKDDIKKGFAGVDETITQTGDRARKMFQDDFADSSAQARKAWSRLVRTGYILQGAIGSIAGALASVIGGIGALAGAVGGAAGSVAAFAGVIAALPAGIATFKLALGGVGAAVSAAIKANKAYSNSLEEARKQLKQLKNDAEEAALAEDEAALRLQKAREALLLTADLPANSIARQQAVLDYRRADLEYRRAAERNKDLKKQLANPPKAKAGEDPFKDLTASQKEFAQYLVTLEPLIKRLKEAASSSLLPILQDQIDRLVNSSKGAKTFFEVIEQGIKRTGTGLGSGITKFVDALTTPRNLKLLEDVFKGIQPVFETMGEVFGSLFGSFLIITKAAFPATQKLLTFIESKAKVFENFLDTKNKSGELTAFFTRATKLAGDLGQVLSNIGGFFGDMIKSNFGPTSGGQYMINVLKQSTLRLRNLREEMGATKMDDYFYQASINARNVLALIGDMGKGLMALGAMSETQITFAELRKAGPYLQKWLEEGAKLGPIMAQIVTNFARFMSIFSESDNVLTFFRVINNVIKTMADIMQNEVIASVVGLIAKFTAFMLAVKTIGAIFKFIFGKVIIGGIRAAYLGMLRLIANMRIAATGATTLGRAMSRIGGPILMVIGTIILALMELRDAQQQAINDTLGNLDDLNSKARSSAYDGVSLLTASIGELDGNLDALFQTYKKGEWGVKESRDANINIQDITKSSSAFKDALTLVNGQMKNTANQLVTIGGVSKEDEQELNALKLAFANTGTALSDLARTNLPLATQKFKDIAQSQRLSKDEQLALLNTMPDLKRALGEAAGAANGLTGDQNLLNIAMGVGDDYANAVATQLYGVEGAAKAAQEKIDGLKEKIFNFGTVTLDTRAAARSFEEAIDAVAEAVLQNGKGLDITTEAGRANSAVLDTLVKSGLDYANSVYEQNGNSAELQANMDKLRIKVEKAAIQMGVGADEAKNLADELIGNKFQIKIAVKELTKAEAEAAVSAARNALKQAGASGYSYKLTAADIANIKAGKIKVNDALNFRYGGYVNAFSAGVPRFAPGGPVFGPGTGTSDSIPAMLSNGEFVVNANATAKNRSLLEAINSGNQSASVGSSVNITVNPSPGMDEKELAAEVSRQLAFAMRKGSSY
jgi:hypothetical protein